MFLDANKINKATSVFQIRHFFFFLSSKDFCKRQNLNLSSLLVLANIQNHISQIVTA